MFLSFINNLVNGTMSVHSCDQFVTLFLHTPGTWRVFMTDE